MFPGLGGVNPKQMQAMMKQLGIKTQDIEAERVIVERSDGKIIIENPSVQKITMQGQESWQITGNAKEITETAIRDEDVALVAEKTKKSKAEARAALEQTKNDIAEAILKLS
jgi:nascent polypeptide-associated complex subunit alpha